MSVLIALQRSRLGQLTRCAPLPFTDKEPDLGFGTHALSPDEIFCSSDHIRLTRLLPATGVTSPFWDRVFGTTYVSQAKAPTTATGDSDKSAPKA